MSFIIRPALAGDAEVVGVLTQQFARYLRDLGDSTDFKLTAETYLRDGFGSRPAFVGLVAENNRKVIGYLLYHFGYDTDSASINFHIVDLYVDVAARRQGAGRALVTRAAALACEAGATEMIWSVYHANELATRFYEKLGARRITDVFFMKVRSALL